MTDDLLHDANVRELTRCIDECERITVLTGAGISTDSGIPDFRGPNGIWTKNPEAEKASNIQNFVSDPEVRKASRAACFRQDPILTGLTPAHLRPGL